MGNIHSTYPQHIFKPGSTRPVVPTKTLSALVDGASRPSPAMARGSPQSTRPHYAVRYPYSRL